MKKILKNIISKIVEVWNNRNQEDVLKEKGGYHSFNLKNKEVDNPWVCGDAVNILLERGNRKKIIPEYMPDFLAGYFSEEKEVVGIPLRDCINYN